MFGTWRESHPYLFNTFFEGEGGTGSGDGGTGDGGTGDKGGASDKTLTQADVDRIVQERVGQTKRQTEEAIAKQLGVPVEEAKKILETQRQQADKDKSEAVLAREAADREKTESETAKAEAAKERHDAKVERALIKALPKDLEDAALDAKVGRLGRLLDVEIGADDEVIKKAVDALKKDEPLLFGVAEGGKGGAPNSDPPGKPPVKKGSDDAFTKGAERAKTLAGSTTYAMLEDKS